MKKWLLSIPIILLSGNLYAATISWTKTFADGQVLSGSDLENMKTDITTVVNAGGGPVTLTANQTVSGDNTFSGTSTFSGIITSTGVFSGGSPIILEGATANAFETTISLVDPTADRTITLPNTAMDLTDFSEWRVKGWIQYDQVSGTATIADGFNATVTDGGTGVAIINWGTDFANTSYAAASMAENAIVTISSISVGALEITTSSALGTPADRDQICIIAIGDQ